MLGIDPGSRFTGYGVVESQGSRLIHIDSGVIRAGTQASLEVRLLKIFSGLEAVLARHNPVAVAVESIPHARNAQSALKLGHARGVALLVAARAQLPLTEHNPMEVKKAIAGYGRADKDQVHAMVERLLGLTIDGPRDRSDALAVAICHLHARASLTRMGLLKDGPRRAS